MQRPLFYFCICPDGGLINEHVTTLLAQSPTENGKAWERHVFWGDEELPPRFWETLTLQGLFATPTLVILRQANAVSADVWKNRLSPALAAAAAHTWTLLCLEVPWEKREPKIPAHIAKLPCMAHAEKKGWVWRQPGLNATSLTAHARTQARAMGLRFGPGALEAFCQSIPPEATAVETGLARLALATELSEDGSITTDMITQGAYTPEANVFGLISCLEAGKLTAAWREVRHSLQGGDNMLFSLLALLHREARLLWQINAGENVRLHPNERQMKERCAARLGFAGTSALLDLLVQTETRVKSGEQSPEQALEILCVDAARLFQSAQGPATRGRPAPD